MCMFSIYPPFLSFAFQSHTPKRHTGAGAAGGGLGNTYRGPQSPQSLPCAHCAVRAPGQPSSHEPSFVSAWLLPSGNNPVQSLRHSSSAGAVGGEWGGRFGGGGDGGGTSGGWIGGGTGGCRGLGPEGDGGWEGGGGEGGGGGGGGCGGFSVYRSGQSPKSPPRGHQLATAPVSPSSQRPLLTSEKNSPPMVTTHPYAARTIAAPSGAPGAGGGGGGGGECTATSMPTTSSIEKTPDSRSTPVPRISIASDAAASDASTCALVQPSSAPPLPATSTTATTLPVGVPLLGVINGRSCTPGLM